MQHRFAASVSLAVFALIVFGGVAHAGPRLRMVTEPNGFSTVANIGIPSVEMIKITPFDSTLGILKEADVRIAGTVEVVGEIPPGALPVGSASNIDVSQRFSGVAGDYFGFVDSPSTPVVDVVVSDSAQPIIHRPVFDYNFTFDESTPGTVFPTGGGVFQPPPPITGSLGAFIDTATATDQLLFEQSVTPTQPELLTAPIQAVTIGAVQVDYSYIPFGTDAFVVDPTLPSGRRVPPSPSHDPYPTNSEPITMDSQIDDNFHQTAVARGTADGFEIGLFLQDRLVSGGDAEAYARASTGYAVSGGSESDFIRASFTLDGAAALSGLGHGYIQLDIANGDGEPLAFFNITFDGRSDRPTVSFLQDGCMPNCEDDPQPYLEGGWDGSQTIEFFIPASDGVIDAILYGFAGSGNGEIATVDFSNTAALTIHPTGDAVVTLASGQSFTAIPEPSTLVLFAGLIAIGLHARRG